MGDGAQQEHAFRGSGDLPSARSDGKGGSSGGVRRQATDPQWLRQWCPPRCRAILSVLSVLGCSLIDRVKGSCLIRADASSRFFYLWNLKLIKGVSSKPAPEPAPISPLYMCRLRLIVAV